MKRFVALSGNTQTEEEKNKYNLKTTTEADLQLVFEKACVGDSVVDLGQKSFDFLHSDAEENSRTNFSRSLRKRYALKTKDNMEIKSSKNTIKKI